MVVKTVLISSYLILIIIFMCLAGWILTPLKKCLTDFVKSVVESRVVLRLKNLHSIYACQFLMLCVQFSSFMTE